MKGTTLTTIALLIASIFLSLAMATEVDVGQTNEANILVGTTPDGAPIYLNIDQLNKINVFFNYGGDGNTVPGKDTGASSSEVSELIYGYYLQDGHRGWLVSSQFNPTGPQFYLGYMYAIPNSTRMLIGIINTGDCDGGADFATVTRNVGQTIENGTLQAGPILPALTYDQDGNAIPGMYLIETENAIGNYNLYPTDVIANQQPLDHVYWNGHGGLQRDLATGAWVSVNTTLVTEERLRGSQNWYTGGARGNTYWAST